MILRSQIVGMHFRPPAKAILEHLPRGASLVIRAEPDNPYDENAVQVLVELGEVPEEQTESLTAQCELMGRDWTEILAEGEPIHLGYCISANNRKLGAWTPNTVVGDLIRSGVLFRARLDFDEAGVAFARIEVEDGQG